MLRSLLVVLILAVAIACSKDTPVPVAPPAGKAADDTFGDFFKVFAPIAAEAEKEALDREARKEQFNIDLVFEENLSSSVELSVHQRDIIRQAANRWEEVIVSDLEDVDFKNLGGAYYQKEHTRWVRKYESEAYVDTLIFDGFVDDLRIYIEVIDNVYDVSFWATAGQYERRGKGKWLEDGTYKVTTGLPIVSFITFYEDFINDIAIDDILFEVALHEIGHALAFSHGLWLSLDLIHPPNGEAEPGEVYFSGQLARQYFDQLGGSAYQGNKVPLYNIGHWFIPLLQEDVMSPFTTLPAISFITIGALADVGYEVNFNAADDIEINWAASKALTMPYSWCGVGR